VGILAYSLLNCAKACANYNMDYGQDICQGAVFTSNLTWALPTIYANCFLKNNRAGSITGGPDTFAALTLLEKSS
jgi:hypothetical protein